MTQRAPMFRPPSIGKRFVRPADKRESSAKRGYGHKWRLIRGAFLKAYPYCSCGAEATEVDHVISLRKGGTNQWSNLRAMCKPCHTRKTNQIDGGGFGHSKKSLIGEQS